MQVGLALPHYDFSFPDGGPVSMDRVVAYAARARDAGFGSVWVSDHLYLDLAKYGGPSTRYRSVEPLTALAAIGAAVDRVRLGTLVLCAAFRPAAMLALAASTLDEATGGRLEVGVGAGWYEDEFRSLGIPFGTTGARMRHMEAVTDVVRDSLEEGRVVEEAGSWRSPKHVRPPVWIGGKGGPRLMRAVAQHADGWNVVWRITPEAYRDRLAVLDEACAHAGRDPATVRRSVGLVCLLGADRTDLERRYDALRRWAPGGALDGTSLERFAEGALVGTPAECARVVKELEALGVEHLVLTFANLPFAVFDDEQIDIAAEALLPAIA